MAIDKLRGTVGDWEMNKKVNETIGVVNSTVATGITTGTAAPVTTPASVGLIYIDTTAKKVYFATGTSASTDWTAVN